MVRRVPLFLVLALLAAAPGARAQDEGPGATVAPEDSADGPLHLTLREAVALALRRNLDLRAAAYSPSIARASVDESAALYDHLFTARVQGGEALSPDPVPGRIDTYDVDSLALGMGVQRLLPTGGVLSLQASSDRTLTNSAFTVLDPRWDSSLNLVLRQPLLRGRGRDVTELGLEFARNNSDLSRLDLRNRTESLVLQVETVYWTLVDARGQVEVQQKSLDVARDLLRIAEARLEAGAGTRVDVSQAAAGVALREVDLLRAENDMRSVEERLMGLVSPRGPTRPGETERRLEPADDPAADLPAVPAEDVATAVETALLRRSDLRAQKVQVEQFGLTVTRARSDALARLDLTASSGFTGLDGNLGQSWSDSVASREFLSWSVGLYLEIPIGNRAARARLRRAELQRDQSEAQTRALENSASVRVRNARRDLESTLRQIEAATRATALAEEQLDAERERLRADKSTTFDVLRLEEDLTRARLSELRALVEYRIAGATYDFETGRILEKRELSLPDAP